MPYLYCYLLKQTKKLVVLFRYLVLLHKINIKYHFVEINIILASKGAIMLHL